MLGASLLVKSHHCRVAPSMARSTPARRRGEVGTSVPSLGDEIEDSLRLCVQKEGRSLPITRPADSHSDRLSSVGPVSSFVDAHRIENLTILGSGRVDRVEESRFALVFEHDLYGERGPSASRIVELPILKVRSIVRAG